MSKTPWWVCVTVRVFRVLLLLYPPSFRREFGESMVQVLRDTSLDTYREHGLPGLADVWVTVLADHFSSIFREHRETLRESHVLACGLPVVWAVLAVVSLGLWIASIGDSIGLFGLGRDLSLRFTNGVIEFRHIDAHRIENPILSERWHETASRRGWVRPMKPDWPVLDYSSGHVLGICVNGLVCPAEYSLLRIPLWLLLIPCLLWSVRATCKGATMTFFRTALLIVLTLVLASPAKAQNRDNAREVVEGYVTAALAGKVADATNLAVPGQSPSRKVRIEEFKELLNGKTLKIASVHVSEKSREALAVSAKVQLTRKNPDGTDQGCIVFKLISAANGWQVKDIDFRSEEAGRARVEQFIKDKPDTKAVLDDNATKK